MLFRTESMMIDVYDHVRESLSGSTTDLSKSVVMNHGGLGPVTSKSIIERKNEFNLFLSTRYIFKNYSEQFISVLHLTNC